MRRAEPCDGASTGSADLPGPELLARQAEWLAPARAHLLRQVHIARRRRILDLGTGYGAIVPELVRRAGGCVVALDCEIGALLVARPFEGAGRVAADGRELPFADGTFDLIFTQLALLWMSPLAIVIAELWRALMPGGVVVALEPDYGGMIEYPPDIATRDLWLTGLERAGADPYTGRRLPGALAQQGFDVGVGLFNTLVEPDPARFTFLHGLSLTDEEEQQLDLAEKNAEARSGPWSEVAHLPFLLIRAEKPAEN